MHSGTRVNVCHKEKVNETKDKSTTALTVHLVTTSNLLDILISC